MTKIKLHKDFIKRYKNFLESDIFIKQQKLSKSKYWEHHAKLIKSSIGDSSVHLDGFSGNYIPPKKNSFDLYYRNFKSLVKKVIRYEVNPYMSYKNALENVIKEKNIEGKHQLNLKIEKIIAKNYSECKIRYPFNYHVSDHIVRSYYYLNILNSYIDFSKKLNLVEIGGGNGNLISLAKHHFNVNGILNIDLPETLSLCIPFVKNLFPDSKILMPNEINKDNVDADDFNEYDFIFLTPSQISLVKKDLIDLSINTASFQEMTMQQIKLYLDFIQITTKNNGYFFCTNSVEKIPVDGNISKTDLLKINPNRFFEYPFKDNDLLIYQLCKFTSLVQSDPVYLRLEKIKKTI